MSRRVEVRMPKLGLTMTEAVIVEWSKATGDRVSAGDVIGIIETEKINAELESPVTGTVAEIIGKEEETYAVGELVAVIEAAE